MWSWTLCAAMIRFLMYCAFRGISMFSAFSTALTETVACTDVQTPQMRWVKSHTSRGSRPLTIVSIPRHIWPDDQAFITLPLSTSHSILRWPSILVIGSIVILFDIAPPVFCIHSGSVKRLRIEIQIFRAYLESQDRKSDHRRRDHELYEGRKVVSSRAGCVFRNAEYTHIHPVEHDAEYHQYIHDKDAIDVRAYGSEREQDERQRHPHAHFQEPEIREKTAVQGQSDAGPPGKINELYGQIAPPHDQRPPREAFQHLDGKLVVKGPRAQDRLKAHHPKRQHHSLK